MKSVLFRSQNYFTKGHEHLGEARNVLEEQSPFVYPPCSLMFSYFQYWKAKKRTTDKERRMDVFKAKDSHDLLRRLRVRNYNFDYTGNYTLTIIEFGNLFKKMSTYLYCEYLLFCDKRYTNQRLNYYTIHSYQCTLQNILKGINRSYSIFARV